MQAPARESPSATSPHAGHLAGGGDPPPAFEEAYLRFAPLLRKIAVGRFRIPAADAEPLVHDVFATYFTHAASVRTLEPYLIGAICNASRHYWRRTAAADELFCGEAPCAATPDDAVYADVERKQLLTRVLARIGAKCRDLLQRYYLHGETTAVLAARLHSTPGSIRVRILHCRDRAKAAVADLLERDSNHGPHS